MLKLPKTIENIGLLFIAIFLCGGYMTGTDWYMYEKFYTNLNFADNAAKMKESGYFLVQTFFSNLGVDFWVFHIVLKLLVFYALVFFVRSFKINIFLFLALFLPEVGLYLFVDCPFRNLISFGIALLALKNLFDNKQITFFVLVAFASFFHLSALFLLVVYFLYKVNIKIYTVLIITVVLYVLAFNVDFLIEKIYLPLANESPIIQDRLKSYFLDSRYIATEINKGTYIRLFIMFILLLFKDLIIADDKKRQIIYNLTILFLLIYPFGVTMKIFHRLSIYLIPFYTFSIIYMLKSFSIKVNKYILYSFFVLWSLMQTYVLIIYDYRYIPYSNYFVHFMKKDLPDIEYRNEYNPKHSPYKAPPAKK